MSTSESPGDPGMPPPSFYREMAKHCRCCPECQQIPCDTTCYGGVCLGGCDCDDYDREEDDNGDE